MLNAIIACRQFTLCWNLLEHIEKIKKDKRNVSHSLEQLMNCEAQLKDDWVKFNKDPYWMVAANHKKDKK